MRRTALRSLPVAVVALALAGCHGTQPLPYGFERGGALPPDDYARLEPLARAQPSSRLAAGDRPIKAYPLVTYVYSFRPGFDAAQITRLDIGSFSGAMGDMAEVAGRLPADLARRLTAGGLPASVLQSAAAPGAYVLSGAVTRAGSPELGPDTDNVAAQVEARITRDSVEVGAMQVNVIVQAGFTARPVLGLLIAAMEGSRSEAVARRIADIMKRSRNGESQATSIDTRHGYIMTPSQK